MCKKICIKYICSSRSISKEEKEKENNKKSSPIKPISSRPLRPSTAPDKIQENDKKKVSSSSVLKNLRVRPHYTVNALK
jgi:hypothetical protein